MSFGDFGWRLRLRVRLGDPMRCLKSSVESVGWFAQLHGEVVAGV